MKRPLSRCQKNLLDFIRDYFCAHGGMAPSVRECAEHFQKCDSTVFEHLEALVRKGRVSRTSQARSIVLQEGFSGRRLTKIPLWETVDAESDFHGQDASEVLMMTLPVRDKRCFAVKVRDDALQMLGVRQGDIAVAEWRAVPKVGDLVVAASGNMPLLMRFSGAAHCRALGVVVAVERFYR